MASRSAPRTCPCCGSAEFRSERVLDDELVRQWRLTPDERDYVDRQQGFHCVRCESKLRTMALARAIVRSHGSTELLTDFLARRSGLGVLEVNEAGQLTPFLAELPGHRLVEYPDVDMTALPFEDGSFDLVLHSDTLEHVDDPVAGLAECRRVLRPGGRLCFTVPMIVGRLTRSRDASEPSYHGDEHHRYLVHTEYGADAWTHIVEAGFSGCGVETLDFPAATAWWAERS